MTYQSCREYCTHCGSYILGNAELHPGRLGVAKCADAEWSICIDADCWRDSASQHIYSLLTRLTMLCHREAEIRLEPLTKATGMTRAICTHVQISLGQSKRSKERYTECLKYLCGNYTFKSNIAHRVCSSTYR